MKTTISILALVAVSLSVSACNTVRGMGRDIERGGEKVQSTATDVQKGGTTSGSSSSGRTSSGTATSPSTTSPSTTSPGTTSSGTSSTTR